jgi:branched-chain amino acid transport system substrate-binding protein
MDREKFDKCLNELTNQQKEVLQRFLKGRSDPEIASQNELCITPETIRTHFCGIYSAFDLPHEMRKRDKLIRLFCKFKRDWVNHSFRDEYDRLRVDDYLDLENIRSDDSNFRLIEGTEYLYQEKYEEAIEIFEKEIAHDPTNPIPKILINNARAYQPKDRPRPFRIAVVVSYSPQNNSHVDATENVLRGIADAQTQFNESGGKDGRWLEVIIANDRNQPKVAKKQAKNLCDVESILVIIGHHSSEGTKAALQIYEEKSIAVISPTSTSSNLSGETFFRTVGSTKAVAKTYIQYIKNYLKLDKVAIFYHPDNEYSQTLKNDVEEACKAEKILMPTSINMRNILLDIEGEIAEITKKTCQAALVLSSIETNKIALDIIRTNSRRKSQKIKLILSTSFPENLMLERILEGENFVEEVVFVRPDLTEKSNYMADAKKRWQQEEINWRFGCSHSAMQAVIEAIRSNNTTREEILNNLRAITKTSGFGLHCSASGNANTEREYCIVQIRNHKFEEIKENE